MNKYIYWIWLRLALRGNVKLMYALYTVAGNVLNIFQAQQKQYAEWGVSKQHMSALLDKDLTKAYDTFGQCEQFGIDILSIEDDDYPETLRQMALPPCLLFYQGNLQDCLSSPTLTAIGTRYSTASGEAIALEFVHDLASAGFAIFCGVAEGIEAAVHRAAVTADGKCVLLLPCGLLAVGKRVSFLIRDVLPHGAVISEYLPNERGPYDTYQIRNRLLGGFTLGTLVLQAPLKSGVHMTVKYALQLERDIFVVPGGLRDPSYAGNNLLLRDGAIPVLEANDIVQYYKPKWKDRLQDIIIEDETYEAFADTIIESRSFDNAEQQMIFAALTAEGKTVDEIAYSSGLPISKILSTLTIMEMKGWVEALPGAKYRTII